MNDEHVSMRAVAGDEEMVLQVVDSVYIISNIYLTIGADASMIGLGRHVLRSATAVEMHQNLEKQAAVR